MSTIIDDLRFSLRLLGRNPAFALIAVAALALGIGADTAIFTVVDGVLLQPLPYPESDRLVMVYESTPNAAEVPVAYPNFLDWRRENRSFTDWPPSVTTTSTSPAPATPCIFPANTFPRLCFESSA